MAKLRPTYAFVKRLEVLSGGRLHFKDSVKVVAFTYNTHGSSSNGIRQFLKDKLPPIQFKNPDVQFVLLKNRKPTPFVDVYFDNGKSVALDVEGKQSENIFSELASVAAIPDVQAQHALQQKAVVNSADFGDGRRGRLCICEVPGQVPCPSRVPLKNIEHSWQSKDSGPD